MQFRGNAALLPCVGRSDMDVPKTRRQDFDKRIAQNSEELQRQPGGAFQNGTVVHRTEPRVSLFQPALKKTQRKLTCFDRTLERPG
jgi:hypothetical protein